MLGIVIAVSGTMVNGDGFEVKEWWNVGLPTQIPPSLTGKLARKKLTDYINNTILNVYRNVIGTNNI